MASSPRRPLSARPCSRTAVVPNGSDAHALGRAARSGLRSALPPGGTSVGLSGGLHGGLSLSARASSVAPDPATRMSLSHGMCRALEPAPASTNGTPKFTTIYDAVVTIRV